MGKQRLKKWQDSLSITELRMAVLGFEPNT